MATVKVLLAGDCGGNFAALFNRVASVNKKNGPFKLLLCVGDFFGPGGACSSSNSLQQLPARSPPHNMACGCRCQGRHA